MEKDKKIVEKRVNLTKLLDETAKNNRKVPVSEIMNLLYTAIITNEEKNPMFKQCRETLGEEAYDGLVRQIVFSMAMNLTVYTLPKDEVLKVIARCDTDKEALN